MEGLRKGYHDHGCTEQVPFCLEEMQQEVSLLINIMSWKFPPHDIGSYIIMCLDLDSCLLMLPFSD